MSIASGTRLGPYEVLSAVGSGGMGEVYRARDTRLERMVAIKVLPAQLARHPELRERFDREARTIAGLNHPNICTLYDVGHQDGIDYLVMELVNGESLGRAIPRDGLPLSEAVDYGAQMASALAAAHAVGVVHRDVKPANAIVGADSQVKLLDFGLAKLMEQPAAASGAERRAAATEIGTVMGTADYMSPEQASGKPVDHRTDIFSLGVTMYEMLAGRRPFERASSVDTIRAIVHEPVPPLEQPPELQEILAKALAKDPKDRYQHAGDLAIDLRRFAQSWRGRSLPSMRGAIPVPARSRRIVWALAAGAVLIAIAALTAQRLLSKRGDVWSNPLDNAKVARLTDFEGAQTNPAISPDGKFVAFISNQGGDSDIWLSQTSSGTLSNLTQGRIGDANAPLRGVGFSADGSEVWSAGVQATAGVQGRRLMLWPLVGGAPHNFLEEHAAEVAWSPDGSRLVYHTWDEGDPVFVADHNGANAREILKSDPGLHNHFQVWSRDARWIYFVRGRRSTREMDLWRISPDGGGAEQLTHLAVDITYPTPLDARTVLYVAPNESGAGPWLWAFDVAARTSRRLSSGLEQYTAVVAAADGRHLAASVVNAHVNLWTVPLTDGIAGEKDVAALQLPNVRAQTPRFGGGALFYLSSRDGADGLWTSRNGQALEIWKGSDGALQSPPAVSTDGNSVAIALRRESKWRMHVIAADGTRLRALSADVDVRGTASWSPDGQWLAAAGSDRDGPGLFKLPTAGGAPKRIATGAFLDPVWSPRGDLIVYCGTQVFTQMPVLAVRPDGTAVPLPAISVRRDGERLRFLPDGSGLVYMLGATPDSQDFWLLDLGTRQSRPLTKLSNGAAMRTFDVSPDGRQIVFDRARDNSDIRLIDLTGVP